LWARAIHNNDILFAFNIHSRNLSLLITAHDAASENAICSWNGDLSLISLMISHATLRTNVHIRTTSLSFSHTLEHYLSLFISSTFIVSIHSYAILTNWSSIWLHVILILISKLRNSLNSWRVLSSVAIFHLTHVLLASLLISHSSYHSTFLLANSLLETVSCFSHLVCS
jgi:hypothetical protein